MTITSYYQHFVIVHRKYDWTIYVVTDNTESVLGIRQHSEHLVEKDTQRLWLLETKPLFDPMVSCIPTIWL